MSFVRTHLTSVVLAALALLTIGVVLATRERPTTSERAERSRNLLLVWREDEIRSLVLESGGKRLELERDLGPAPTADAGDQKSEWTLKAPAPEPADGAAVERVIAGLGFATPVRRADPVDPATVGLRPPRATLGVDLGSVKYRLALGNDAPTPAGAAYVAVEGDGIEPFVAVVTKQVAALFLTQADDFRERGVIGLGMRGIQELSLEKKDGTLRLVRSGGLAFRIDGNERASRDALEPVFGALSRLEATHFLTVADAERAQGGAPALVVRVTPTDPKAPKAVVELGGDCPGAPGELVAIVRRPRLRGLCFDRKLLGALEPDRERLGDPAPFSARPDEVETLRIERGKKRLVLTRKGPAFLLREPSEAQVELEAGNQRLAAIVRAPAELVVGADPKTLGLDPPEGRVTATTIGDDDKATDETLLLGRVEPDGTLHVRREGDGAVLTLGREAARAFVVDSTLLKSRRVVDFALSALAELELSSPEHQLLRRASSGFELVVPKGFSHDGALATDAVLALGSLTALQWVSDADDGSFGLAKPALTASARVDADGGPRSYELVIGRPTPGGYFAKLTSDSGVFVVERVVAERLGTLLIDRAAFMVDPASVARLTLTAKGTTRALERQHGELVPATGSGIDPAVATRLIEALAALRAEAAVHTGPTRPSEGLATPALEVRVEPVTGVGKPRIFRIGALGGAVPSAESGQALRYARAEGVDATFAIAATKLQPLFDLF